MLTGCLKIAMVQKMTNRTMSKHAGCAYCKCKWHPCAYCKCHTHPVFKKGVRAETRAHFPYLLGFLDVALVAKALLFERPPPPSPACVCTPQAQSVGARRLVAPIRVSPPYLQTWIAEAGHTTHVDRTADSRIRHIPEAATLFGSGFWRMPRAGASPGPSSF